MNAIYIFKAFIYTLASFYFLFNCLYIITNFKWNGTQNSLQLRNSFFKTFFSIVGKHSTENEVTVITIFFYDGKYSTKKLTSIQNFMQSVSSPLIVFCDEHSLDILASFRKGKATTFFIIDSIWDVIRYHSKSRNASNETNYITKQFELDSEKNKSNANLYAIRNSKIFLINFATELNLYKSNFFIYSEIDDWAKERFENWPDVKFVKNLNHYLHNKTIHLQLHYFKDVYHNSIYAGFVAGSRGAISKLYENFYQIHDQLINENKFVGNEDITLNSLVFARKYDFVTMLKNWKINCSNPNDEGELFYQKYLAHQKDFKCLKERISIIETPSSLNN